jgi:dihydrofolate reductase
MEARSWASSSSGTSGERNIFVVGSAKLTSSLRKAGLIDEYRICIALLLLGVTGGAHVQA